MDKIFKFSFLLMVLTVVLSSCEIIEHGREALFGNYTTDIEYDNSLIELAVDLDFDGDQNLSTNPPTTYMTFDSTSKKSFIDVYFIEGVATLYDLGNDSVLYTDSKRVLRGAVYEDSLAFKLSSLGDAPAMEGVVIDSTSMQTSALSVSNQIQMTYHFSGTGSVEFSPGIIKQGLVRGTVKVSANK